MQIPVDDLVINYQITGTGPTILMLHGWGDSLSTFYDLANDLKKDYQVVLLDLPGFGQSSHLPKAWTYDDYSQFLENFIRKLKLKVDYLIGHSNGGSIAIYSVATKKVTPRKLILLSSAGIRQNDARRQAIKVIAKTGKIATAVFPRRIKKNIRSKFYTAIGSDLLAIPHMQETFLLTIKIDLRDKSKLIKIPTLLIYGEDDKATPVEFGEIYHKQISGSQLKVIESSGHFVQRDQPIQIIREIRRFIE